MLLGVMASDVRLAVRALRDYCQALGLPFKVSDAACEPLPVVSPDLGLKGCLLAAIHSLTIFDLPSHAPTPNAVQMPESRVPEVAAAPAITGPVYVKFNSVSGLCYASRYEGRDRGVLVQLGQQQLGHFPLGLHDEQMLQPPPPAG